MNQRAFDISFILELDVTSFIFQLETSIAKTQLFVNTSLFATACLAFTLLHSAEACSNVLWAQCGGWGYSGLTCCPSGSSCNYQNDYYWQCLPSSDSGATTTTQASATTKPSSGSHNYAEVLAKSLVFYYGQMSGKISGTFNTLSWRGDSATQDASDYGADLSGGFYDAGDHVKFNFPLSYTLYTLALSGIQYESTFRATGEEWQRLLNLIKWGTDYFLKCHTDTYEFYGQVGQGDLDHAYWGPPEKMTMSRPSFKITASNPGSDLAGSVAATFALSSILFRDVNPTYSSTLLQHARQMWEFATKYQGTYVDAIPDAKTYYNSFSGYKDEQLLGALALYWATNEAQYRNYAIDNSRSLVSGSLGYAPGWDDASYANVFLLWKLLGDSDAQKVFETWADYFMNKVQKTPQGFVYLTEWGCARYPLVTGFFLLSYVDSNPSLSSSKANSYINFAKQQLGYVLGDNKAGLSYLVGYGNKWPQHYHHRAAHGSTTNNMYDPKVNKYTNYEIVGGPDSNDGYADDISNYAQSEGANDMQAGLVGLAVAMVKRFGGTPLLNFP